MEDDYKIGKLYLVWFETPIFECVPQVCIWLNDLHKQHNIPNGFYIFNGYGYNPPPLNDWRILKVTGPLEYDK